LETITALDKDRLEGWIHPPPREGPRGLLSATRNEWIRPLRVGVKIDPKQGKHLRLEWKSRRSRQRWSLWTSTHMNDNRCGLNRSAQHSREVYSLESRSPKFFAGVDLGAARSCPVGIACSRKGRFSSADIVAASGSCFRWFLAARPVRITEVDFHIRSFAIFL
jgi:hypothetical protein